MADVVSKEQRSKNMAAIKGKDTKPEIYFRKLLFAKGYRYRNNSSTLPGHPDIYLKKYNTVIFVNGCFWHRHNGCKYAYKPKSNIEFWQKKFESNRLRDKKECSQLKQMGIKCLVVWECTIKRMKRSEEFRQKIIDATIHFLSDKKMYLEL